MTSEYITLLGIAVQTALFLLGGYAMVLKSNWSNDSLNAKVTGMETKLEGLATIITKLAVQDERLNNQAQRLTSIDDKIERLRRGEGFIAGARGIEHEH